MEKVSKVNYQLELLKKLRLHPVFHVSLLEPAPENVPIATDAEVQPENKPDIYDVEEILDQQVSNGKVEYLVKWLNWGLEGRRGGRC